MKPPVLPHCPASPSSQVPRTSIKMTVYLEFIDRSTINTQLGSVNYALALIRAGLPIASLQLGATSTNSYPVFTGGYPLSCSHASRT